MVHTVSADCWCEPWIIEQADCWMIVHQETTGAIGPLMARTKLIPGPTAHEVED